MRKLFLLILASILLFSCNENSKNLRETEATKIEAFVKDKGFTRHESGVYYKVLNPPTEPQSPRPKITTNETIKIWYSAATLPEASATLSNYIFSTNVPSIATETGINFDESTLVIKEIIIGSSNIINGLENAILSLSKGDSAEIVIPFSLGYGEIDNGAVPGYSTLYYKIGIN